MSITMGDISRFKFLAHKVMPLVFDESLSYYEFLCKVITKLNEVIDNENEQNNVLEDFSVQMDEWNEEAIQKYNEFTAAIDAEIEEFERTVTEGQSNFETTITNRVGEFETDINEDFTDFSSEMRTAWNEFFDDYLQTLGVVQTTGTSETDVMSQKATTDELNKISTNYLVNYIETLFPQVNYYYNATGEKVNTSNLYTHIEVNNIPCNKTLTLTFTEKNGAPNVRIVEYNNDSFIQRQLVNTNNQSITLNSNTNKFIVNMDLGPSSYFVNPIVFSESKTAIDSVARNAISSIRANETFSLLYDGNSIKPKNYFNLIIKTPEDAIRGQGLACFGNIGVKSQMQSSSPYNLESFTFFNMDTLETIIKNVVPVDDEGVGVLHCNTISFGNEYYNESDVLPLLYCSGNDIRAVWAYRIDNNYTMTCVQKINFPDISIMPTYRPCSCVDKERNVICVSANSNNSSPFYGTGAGGAYANNTQTYYLFRLPKINEGSTVNLTLNSTDLIKQFVLPAFTVRQGFQCEDGIIYHAFGNQNATLDPIIRLVCIDTDNENVINAIPLNRYGLTTEPEGLCIYNGKIFIDYGNYYIFDFK